MFGTGRRPAKEGATCDTVAGTHYIVNATRYTRAMTGYPIARALAAAVEIERARDAMREARERLRQAVIDARATMSAAEVARALDISRARVYAIAAGRE